MGRLGKKYLYLTGLFLAGCFLLTAGFGCSLNSTAQQNAIKPITLTYWRVYDDSDAFDAVIKDYQIDHPNIQIQYRKFRYEEFESELLNALAEDRGPDIFSIPESWLYKYQTKLAPMPDQITMGYVVEKNYFNIKKEQVVEVRTTAAPTLFAVKDQYVDTVATDAVINNQLYGLPLSLETLVMFYNKDILNQAGITAIPTDWKTFQDDVVKATKYQTDNKIIQAGTALGTGFNVEHCFDILSVLMMQSGAVMADSRGYPTFFSTISNSKSGANSQSNPGLTALQFYSDFANQLKDVYSWNSSMPDSLQAFMAGQVGFYFGYTYDLPTIRSGSHLNFGLAPIPQIAGNAQSNYANYWLEVVSKKSAHTNEAWDFLLFLNQPAEIKKFLDVTKHPTAEKSLISDQLNDPDLHAAASQALTAQTWYIGKDFPAAEEAFKEMVEQYLLAVNPNDINKILQNATEKVSQTINPASSQ